jgi:hypothetical protein
MGTNNGHVVSQHDTDGLCQTRLRKALRSPVFGRRAESAVALYVFAEFSNETNATQEGAPGATEDAAKLERKEARITLQGGEHASRQVQLLRNACAPHHSPETTAKVLRLTALRLARKGRSKDKSIDWTFERIADELGLSRDQVAGIIGRERRRRKAWRRAASVDRGER